MSSARAAAAAEPPPFGGALRRYRGGRRMSQLDLALTCGVSARHLSFLESGRAQPSREMTLRLAEGLRLPLGARNALLQAAGYAAAFPASPLDSAALGPFRAVLDEMIARHSPNPALLCDRYWTILDANPTARAMLSAFQPDDPESGGGGGGAAPNMVQLLSDNPLAAAFIANLPEVLQEMAERLRLELLEAGGDAVLEAMLSGVEAAAARHPAPPGAAPRRPLTPFVLNLGGRSLRFLSAIAHFGTTQDVTVRDLRLELLFPADDDTRAAVAAMG